MKNPRQVFQDAAAEALRRLDRQNTPEARKKADTFRRAIQDAEEAPKLQAARVERMARLPEVLKSLEPAEAFFRAEGLKLLREGPCHKNLPDTCSVFELREALKSAFDIHGNLAREFAKIIDALDDVRCAAKEAMIDLEANEAWKYALRAQAEAAHDAANQVGADFEALLEKMK